MDESLKVFEEKMEKTLDNLMSEFATIRAGRANAAVLNKIMVDYYGTPTPIPQMANISVPEARILQIQPWDRSTLKAIEKAINTSELGIHPNNDGSIIRLIFPELTEDRRKELSKDVKKKGEAAKVALRNIRRDANDKIKKAEKNGELTEDDLKAAENDIQKMTDKYIGKGEKEMFYKTEFDVLFAGDFKYWSMDYWANTSILNRNWDRKNKDGTIDKSKTEAMKDNGNNK